MKKIVAVVAAVLLGVMLPLGGMSLNARAEGPVTYTVKYVDSAQDFRFEIKDESGNVTYREIYYMQQDIKDGDIVVVDANGHDFVFSKQVRLGNLTTVSGGAVMTVSGVQECYVLQNSTCVVNGDVDNAYVYDNGVANFNNNVNELRIQYASSLASSVSVLGTVGHVVVNDGKKDSFVAYNVQKDKFRFVNGTWQVPEEYYSKEPSASEPAAPAAPAAGASSSGASSSGGDYDEVPKTGDGFLELWMFGAAAVCFLGGYKLKKN